MKWTGNERALAPKRAIATTITASALVLLMVAGCHHTTVEENLAAGDQAMQNTKLAEAENSYHDAAASAPDDPRPHVALGNLYVFEQKPSQAEAEYMKALELDKRNPATHTALGTIFAGQQQLGMAEEQYRAAVAIDPTNPTYRINIGGLLQKQGKTGEAESQLRTAIGLDPKNAHAHLALAKLLSGEADRSAEAENEFAQVRTLDPSLMTSAPPPEAGAPSEPSEGTASAPTPPANVVAAPVPAPAAVMPKMKLINRKFQLTHDSPVYESPQQTANVIAQVHRRKYVHVTGITGNWFRIQMRSGTIGYIPLSAAE